MSNELNPLDLEKTYRQISRPPIVEAIIHWQAFPTVKLDPTEVLARFQERFPRFTTSIPLQSLEFVPNLSPVGETSTAQHHLGYRLLSEDRREVIQIFRDGVSYSLLNAYTHWDYFVKAAEPVWSAHADLVKPVELSRVAVRFINHFPTVTLGSLGSVLREPPTCPANLPLTEFVYQSAFDVPGRHYGARVIKLMQKSTPGLFLDIEAFTSKATIIESNEHQMTLRHLRGLKNAVFFSLITNDIANSQPV